MLVSVWSVSGHPCWFCKRGRVSCVVLCGRGPNSLLVSRCPTKVSNNTVYLRELGKMQGCREHFPGGGCYLKSTARGIGRSILQLHCWCLLSLSHLTGGVS